MPPWVRHWDSGLRLPGGPRNGGATGHYGKQRRCRSAAKCRNDPEGCELKPCWGPKWGRWFWMVLQHKQQLETFYLNEPEGQLLEANSSGDVHSRTHRSRRGPHAL